jgi:hypothetical protein
VASAAGHAIDVRLHQTFDHGISSDRKREFQTRERWGHREWKLRRDGAGGQ